jgi:hypothetical protein
LDNFKKQEYKKLNQLPNPEKIAPAVTESPQSASGGEDLQCKTGRLLKKEKELGFKN